MSKVKQLDDSINAIDYEISVLRLKKRKLNEERKQAIIRETAEAKLSALKPEELLALGITTAKDQTVSVSDVARANFGK